MYLWIKCVNGMIWCCFLCFMGVGSPLHQATTKTARSIWNIIHHHQQKQQQKQPCNNNIFFTLLKNKRMWMNTFSPRCVHFLCVGLRERRWMITLYIQSTEWLCRYISIITTITIAPQSRRRKVKGSVFSCELLTHEGVESEKKNGVWWWRWWLFLGALYTFGN